MPVALVWIYLRTHEGNWMLKYVQEHVKIISQESCDNILVVPFPNHVACPSFNRLGAYISRNAKLRKMGVTYSLLFEQSCQIVLAQVRAVHADRILSNVDEGSDVTGHECK
jgi:hypothetical protein